MRVLTDETLQMSYDTMEKMILDAVRDKPTMDPSRTEHFRKKAMASTAYREFESDSSESEGGVYSKAEKHYPDSTDEGEMVDFSSLPLSSQAPGLTLLDQLLPRHLKVTPEDRPQQSGYNPLRSKRTNTGLKVQREKQG